MEDAEGQSAKRAREEGEGSIWDSFEREKRGRLRRVVGTERERAWFTRAAAWAA